VYAPRVSESVEIERILVELEQAGLATIGIDDDGTEWWALTPTGAQVARQVGMSADEDELELLSTLVEAAQGHQGSAG
jgi:hypothetical protein